MLREAKIPEVGSYPSEGPTTFVGGHRLSTIDAIKYLRQIAEMEPGDLMAVYVARVALGVRQPPNREG